MAEGVCKEPAKNPDQEGKDKDDSLECAVCLQTCVHPARLPCGHIFCFLCVKGIANQSKKCAMCRQEIPRDFLEQPNLVQCHNPAPENPDGFDGGYQWFYEGRNGWWRYDPRSNEDVERAFKLGLSQVDILICSDVYVIDFVNGCQFCKKQPMKKRNIKRDKTENLQNVKGVAGWWQYDERTSKELEQSYKAGEKTCELLIAGFLYILDLENMIQLRRNDPNRRRKVKRDFGTVPKKGIAGLRNEESSGRTERSVTTDGTTVNIDGRTVNTDGRAVIPVTPSNTPPSPTSGRESPHEEPDLHATVERIRSLRLDDVDINLVDDQSDDDDTLDDGS